MSTTAYWKIRARLLRVPGVANVAIWGEQLQQMHVQVIPKRLRQLHVSLDDVMTATADSLDAGLLKYSDGAVIGTGGSLETPIQQLSIRHILPIISPEDMSQVVVKERDGKTIVLGDVAKVLIDHQPLGGDAVVNNGPGLLLVVEKFPWGNTLEVTRGVEAALDEMRPGLPGDRDRLADLPGRRTSSTTPSRISRIRSCSACLLDDAGPDRVPVRLAQRVDQRGDDPAVADGGGLVLHLRGVTINTMILAGFVIALGAVVDDAIVDCENIVRRLRIHRKMQRRSVGRDDGEDHLRRVAGGPRGGGLRLDDRGVGVAADLLPAEPDRLVLPPAGRGVCPGGRGLDARRADRHAGDWP